MAQLSSTAPSLSPAVGVKHNGGVRVTAKVDYAVRALLELAVATDGPVKGERIAQAQGIPLKFLENILIDLRHANIVRAQRGAEGGYWLARPANEVTLGEIIRAVEGPLASVRGEPPEDVSYTGAAENLRTVWVAVRASLRAVVDELTLADVVADRLPTRIRRLTEAPDAWSRR
jgi:Rrf2 family protein